MGTPHICVCFQKFPIPFTSAIKDLDDQQPSLFSAMRWCSMDSESPRKRQKWFQSKGQDKQKGLYVRLYLRQEELTLSSLGLHPNNREQLESEKIKGTSRYSVGQMCKAGQHGVVFFCNMSTHWYQHQIDYYYSKHYCYASQINRLLVSENKYSCEVIYCRWLTKHYVVLPLSLLQPKPILC